MTSTEDSSKPDPTPAAEVYEDPPPAPAPPPRSGNRTTLVIASVALAGVLSAPYWTAPLYRVLHLRPAGLEWQARQDVETGRLAQSLAELDRRLSDLGGVVAKAGEQAAGVKAAQSAIETQVRVLALLQLRAVLRRPVPFDAELKAVRAFGGRHDDLEPLLAIIEPYASTGIPLDSQLRREFATVADAVGRTEARPGMLHWLGGFAGWSPASAPATPVALEAEPRGERASVVADRAASLVADNDLRAAAAELAHLDGDAAAAVRAWLGQTQARLAANQAAERIAEHVATATSRLPR